MSSLAVTQSLASIFVPLGIAGSCLAVLCALVAGWAVFRRAADLCGGASGVWIVGALLSAAAGFSSNWIPLLVAAIALPVGLIGGVLVRVLVTSWQTREPREQREKAPQAEHATA